LRTPSARTGRGSAQVTEQKLCAAFSGNYYDVQGIISSKESFLRKRFCQLLLDYPKGVDDDHNAHDHMGEPGRQRRQRGARRKFQAPRFRRRRCGRRPGAKGRQRTKHYSLVKQRVRQGRTIPKSVGGTDRAISLLELARSLRYDAFWAISGRLRIHRQRKAANVWPFKSINGWGIRPSNIGHRTHRGHRA
jgi:hypothetical protein